MLVEVTRGEYGFWDDTIAVFYPGTVDVYEDDIINLWGECTGAYQYTSVAGWNLSVPGILARYVEKAR